MGINGTLTQNEKKWGFTHVEHFNFDEYGLDYGFGKWLTEKYGKRFSKYAEHTDGTSWYRVIHRKQGVDSKRVFEMDRWKSIRGEFFKTFTQKTTSGIMSKSGHGDGVYYCYIGISMGTVHDYAAKVMAACYPSHIDGVSAIIKNRVGDEFEKIDKKNNLLCVHVLNPHTQEDKLIVVGLGYNDFEEDRNMDDAIRKGYTVVIGCCQVPANLWGGRDCSPFYIFAREKLGTN